MAQLIVRNLDEEVVKRLKVRAAQHGRSAEAEHRLILEEALRGRRSTMNLKQLLLEMPSVGEDPDFARISGEPRDLEL